MKFAISSVLAVVLASSMATAAVVEPAPTPALQERQNSGGVPIDFSSLLADPSAALQQVGSLLQTPAVSSAFRSLVTQSAYQSQISEQLISQFGSQTGEAALRSYSVVVASLLGESAPAASSTSASAGTGSSSSSSAASTGNSSGSSGTNAGSSLFTFTTMGGAVVAGAAAVMAML